MKSHGGRAVQQIDTKHAFRVTKNYRIHKIIDKFLEIFVIPPDRQSALSAKHQMTHHKKILTFRNET